MKLVITTVFAFCHVLLQTLVMKLTDTGDRVNRGKLRGNLRFDTEDQNHVLRMQFALAMLQYFQ